MTVRSLSQYNTSSHEISNNVRFNFTTGPAATSNSFITILSQTPCPRIFFGRKDRQLIVKATYLRSGSKYRANPWRQKPGLQQSRGIART